MSLICSNVNKIMIIYVIYKSIFYILEYLVKGDYIIYKCSEFHLEFHLEFHKLNLFRKWYIPLCPTCPYPYRQDQVSTLQHNHHD